ncbi:MAG: response regulator transcription factor [Acidobacteriia bacterium]|nr:response regulator transcription factor [Terriglobia bacterium]
MSSQGTNGAAVRVLVADTTTMGSQLILEALRRDDRLEVVGVLTAADDSAALPSDLNPHVAVVGVSADGSARRGFALLRQGLARYPGVKPVFLLDCSTPELVVEAFRAGARGVVCRDDSPDVLRNCVYAVHAGQIWADSAQLGFVLDAFSRRWVPQTIVDSKGRPLLSKRELDVVRCVSEGMTNREIAARLSLSEHTVKNYIFRIFDKLGVSSRAELILYAMRPEGGTQESTFALSAASSVAVA